jgi:hypothetical protein
MKARLLVIAVCAYAGSSVASIQFNRIAIKLRGNSREKIELIKGNSSSNHVQLRTIRDYGVCSRQVTVAQIVMPIGRYIAWVGTALLLLLFVANWFLPQSMAEPTGDEVNRPVIRIASMQ